MDAAEQLGRERGIAKRRMQAAMDHDLIMWLTKDLAG
jgi:hypothetical protein